MSIGEKRTLTREEREREREAKKGKIKKRRKMTKKRAQMRSIRRSWTRVSNVQDRIDELLSLFWTESTNRRPGDPELGKARQRSVERGCCNEPFLLETRRGSCALIARDGWPETAETFISAGGGRLSKVSRLFHRWMANVPDFPSRAIVRTRNRLRRSVESNSKLTGS